MSEIFGQPISFGQGIKASDIVDNLTSTATNKPLSANLGRVLNNKDNELTERINNLSNLGRYLSQWDCTTGLPETEPSTIPYAYHSGDYYRVGVVAASGSTNYKPNGSSYTGDASTTQETEEVASGDVYFYDGTTWSLLINHGGGAVADVRINDTSIVAQKIANIQTDSAPTSGSTKLVESGGTYTAINSHTSNTSNPHSVTASQVGLGNALNAPFALNGSGAPSNNGTVYGQQYVDVSSGDVYDWIAISNSYTLTDILNVQQGEGGVNNFVASSLYTDYATPALVISYVEQQEGGITYLSNIYADLTITEAGNYYFGYQIKGGMAAYPGYTKITPYNFNGGSYGNFDASAYLFDGDSSTPVLEKSLYISNVFDVNTYSIVSLQPGTYTYSIEYPSFSGGGGHQISTVWMVPVVAKIPTGLTITSAIDGFSLGGSVNIVKTTPQWVKSATASALNTHTSNTSNPHTVTKELVGLGNVNNTSDADKPVSNATSALVSAHTSNTSNPHSVTKELVGLGNVENKSSSTIRSEITSLNVIDSLGYTPLSKGLEYVLIEGGSGTIDIGGESIRMVASISDKIFVNPLSYGKAAFTQDLKTFTQIPSLGTPMYYMAGGGDVVNFFMRGSTASSIVLCLNIDTLTKTQASGIGGTGSWNIVSNPSGTKRICINAKGTVGAAPIYQSSDGINWTSTSYTFPTLSSYSNPGLAYINDRFWAFDTNSGYYVSYSFDGLTWSTPALSNQSIVGYSEPYLSIAYFKGKYYMCNDKYIYSSTDCVNWTACSSAFTYFGNWNFIVTDGKIILAYRCNYNYTVEDFVYSYDGVNWTAAPLPITAYWARAAVNSSGFIIVNTDTGDYVRSTDGIHWSGSSEYIYQLNVDRTADVKRTLKANINLSTVSLPTASWVLRIDYTTTASTNISEGTASVDKNTFLTQITTAGTYVFNYDIMIVEGEAVDYWTLNGVNVNPADYGITWTGTLVAASSKITVVLVVDEKDIYYQTITITGSTATSKIDLQPDSTVISLMLNDQCTSLYVENNNNVLTAYSIGRKLTSDVTVQYTMYEVTT